MSEHDELRLRADEVHWQELDGEVVALAVRTSTYIAANRAGTLLWRALAEGSTRERLAHALATAFGISEQRALADTDRFLAELSANDLLER